jgi:hypothetical protein
MAHPAPAQIELASHPLLNGCALRLQCQKLRDLDGALRCDRIVPAPASHIFKAP